MQSKTLIDLKNNNYTSKELSTYCHSSQGWNVDNLAHAGDGKDKYKYKDKKYQAAGWSMHT